ncbi:MAG: hypothetical protein AB1452_12280, partial [Pseudomonadota bacterium]
MNEQGMAGWSVAALAGAKARIAALGAHLHEAPAETLQILESGRGAPLTGAGVRGVTYNAIQL